MATATATSSGTITIGEVAAATGVPAHTLRYYERIGLISGVERGPGGERRYATADLDWIAFVKRLKATGMPLRMMVRFAELRRLGTATVPERTRLLDEHVRRRVAQLERDLEAIAAKRVLLDQQLQEGGDR
jgi:DNA-binding transcriptional MerR regulator